MQHYLQSDTVI